MGIQSVSQLGNSNVPSPATPQGASPAVAAVAQTAQAVSTQQAQKSTAPDSKANLEQALKQIEEAVQARANNLQFSVDDTTGQTVVRVIDSSSGDTIRQIPSEEALAIAKDIERMKGLLLRDSA